MIITTGIGILIFIIINLAIWFAYFIGKLKAQVDKLKQQFEKEFIENTKIENQITSLKIELAELKGYLNCYVSLKI